MVCPFRYTCVPNCGMFEAAVVTAMQCHAGQVDKAGQPYLLHVFRVAGRGRTLEEQVLGLLHDTREDSDIKTDVLRLSFTDEIIEALAAITREPGEAYDAYIERLAHNDLARRVKIHDLCDNLDVTRLSKLLEHLSLEQIRTMRERYYKARTFLYNIQQISEIHLPKGNEDARYEAR